MSDRYRSRRSCRRSLQLEAEKDRAAADEADFAVHRFGRGACVQFCNAGPTLLEPTEEFADGSARESPPTHFRIGRYPLDVPDCCPEPSRAGKGGLEAPDRNCDDLARAGRVLDNERHNVMAETFRKIRPSHAHPLIIGWRPGPGILLGHVGIHGIDEPNDSGYVSMAGGAGDGCHSVNGTPC